MTTELQFLIYSVVLGLAHLIAASHFISHQYGYRWTAGNREEVMPPLKGMAGRVDRATTNFLETFPFFAAVVLVAQVAECHNTLTILGVHLYFWGRSLWLSDLEIESPGMIGPSVCLDGGPINCG